MFHNTIHKMLNLDANVKIQFKNHFLPRQGSVVQDFSSNDEPDRRG